MALAIPTILSGTDVMPPAYGLLSIDVRSEVNRIPSAEIRLIDGNAKNEYKISDGAFFEPGKEIEIKLRYSKKPDVSIFKGVIVRQTLEWGAAGSSLVVHLKDAAVKLAGTRRSAVYAKNKTDEMIIKELLDAAGVGVGTITPSSPEHPGMVQYDCTAWDFIVLRAEALGMLVTAEAGAVSVREMTAAGASHAFTWGTNMYEFEVEAAAESPYKAITSVAWDPTQNTLTNPPIQAADAGKPPGNLDPGALATAVGREECVLKHPVPTVPDELKLWADARMARSRLAMLRGRISIPGDGSIKLLDTVTLRGVGKRFSGEAMVSAVRHRYDGAGWRTDVQLGLSPERLCQRDDIAEVPAAGLLPPVRGLQIGVVAAFESDTTGELRVKVILPGVDERPSGAVWARMAALDAGKNRGFFFRPEEGDEVVVGFLSDDPRHPVILGSLFGSKNSAPTNFSAPSAANEQRGLVSKKGTMVRFIDDDVPSVQIATPGGSTIVISDDGADIGVLIQDKNKNAILLNKDGITIDAGQGSVTIKGAKVDIQ